MQLKVLFSFAILNAISSFQLNSIRKSYHFQSRFLSSSLSDVETVPTTEGVKNIGHAHTETSKAKISAGNKGKAPWNQGKQHSEETRKRIAEKTKEAAVQRKLQQATDMGFTLLEYDEYKKNQTRIKQQIKRGLLITAENGTLIPSPNSTNILRGGLTDEGRKRISDSIKARWQDDEYRTRYTLAKGREVSMETRQRISEALKIKWQDDDYRARCSSTNLTAEQREKISSTLKHKWSTDAEFKQRMKNSLSYSRTPEWKASVSQKIKDLWNDPNYRDKVVDGYKNSTRHYNVNTPPRARKRKYEITFNKGGGSLTYTSKGGFESISDDDNSNNNNNYISEVDGGNNMISTATDDDGVYIRKSATARAARATQNDNNNNNGMMTPVVAGYSSFPDINTLAGSFSTSPTSASSSSATPVKVKAAAKMTMATATSSHTRNIDKLNKQQEWHDRKEYDKNLIREAVYNKAKKECHSSSGGRMKSVRSMLGEEFWLEEKLKKSRPGQRMIDDNSLELMLMNEWLKEEAEESENQATIATVAEAAAVSAAADRVRDDLLLNISDEEDDDDDGEDDEDGVVLLGGSSRRNGVVDSVGAAATIMASSATNDAKTSNTKRNNSNNNNSNNNDDEDDEDDDDFSDKDSFYLSLTKKNNKSSSAAAKSTASSNLDNGYDNNNDDNQQQNTKKSAANSNNNRYSNNYYRDDEDDDDDDDLDAIEFVGVRGSAFTPNDYDKLFH